MAPCWRLVAITMACILMDAAQSDKPTVELVFSSRPDGLDDAIKRIGSAGYVVMEHKVLDVNSANTHVLYSKTLLQLTPAESVALQAKLYQQASSALVVIATADTTPTQLATFLSQLSGQSVNFDVDQYLQPGADSKPLSDDSDASQALISELLVLFSPSGVSLKSLSAGLQPTFLTHHDASHRRQLRAASGGARKLLQAGTIKLPEGAAVSAFKLALGTGAGEVHVLGMWCRTCMKGQLIMPGSLQSYHANMLSLTDDQANCPLGQLHMTALSGQRPLPVPGSLVAFTSTINDLSDSDLNGLTSSLQGNTLYLAPPPFMSVPTQPNLNSLNAALERVLGLNPFCSFVVTREPSFPHCPNGKTLEKQLSYSLPAVTHTRAFLCMEEHASVVQNADGAAVVSFKVPGGGEVQLLGFDFGTAVGEDALAWGSYLYGALTNNSAVQATCSDAQAVPLLHADADSSAVDWTALADTTADDTTADDSEDVVSASDIAATPIAAPLPPVRLGFVLANTQTAEDMNFASLARLPALQQLPADKYLPPTLSASPRPRQLNTHVLLDTTFSALPVGQKVTLAAAVQSGQAMVLITTPQSTGADITRILTAVAGLPIEVAKERPLRKNTQSQPVYADEDQDELDAVIKSLLQDMAVYYPSTYASDSQYGDALYVAAEVASWDNTPSATCLQFAAGNGRVIVLGYAQEPKVVSAKNRR